MTTTYIEHEATTLHDRVSIFEKQPLYYMSSNSHDTHGTQYTKITTLDELKYACRVYIKEDS